MPHAMYDTCNAAVLLFMWVQASGNHELEPQPDGRLFTAYNARYPGPQDPTRLNTAPVDYWSDRSDNNLYSAYTVHGFATVVRSSAVHDNMTCLHLLLLFTSALCFNLLKSGQLCSTHACYWHKLCGFSASAHG